jgi:hypothetical protein
MNERRDRTPITDVLQFIARTPSLRREMIWMRAKERYDEATLAYLEEADPGVGDRVRAYFETRAPEMLARAHEAGGGEPYGSMYDRFLDDWIAFLTAGPCESPNRGEARRRCCPWEHPPDDP